MFRWKTYHLEKRHKKKNVLRNRYIKTGLEDHKKEKDELWALRLEYTKSVKTPPWTKKTNS